MALSNLEEDFNFFKKQTSTKPTKLSIIKEILLVLSFITLSMTVLSIYSSIRIKYSTQMIQKQNSDAISKVETKSAAPIILDKLVKKEDKKSVEVAKGLNLKAIKDIAIENTKIISPEDTYLKEKAIKNNVSINADKLTEQEKKNLVTLSKQLEQVTKQLK